MMRAKLKAFLGCESGTQMLEFAFLLPFLLLMFAAVVEMGRMFYTYTTLNKGTEVAARFLTQQPVLSGNYSTADLATAKNLVVCGKDPCTVGSEIVSGLSSSNVTVTNPGTGVGTRYLTVTVTYNYTPKIWNLSHLAGSGSLSLNFTFTPAITMRYVGS
jgi:Flp pilus assembly protein TadG